MRYAIYARVSTDMQSEHSTDDQIRQCKQFVEHRGGFVSAVYCDEAVSGSDVSRSEYQRLKAGALSGAFEAIVVDDLSRIGRDMPEFVGLCRDLADCGITLIGVADGIDTSNPSAKIPLYIKGMMNELYLDDLKARIVRGLKGQFLRGYSTGGRVYGYKTKQILDPSGALDKFNRPKRLGCEILIDTDQAYVVRRIFELRASGLGFKAIAKALNSDKIPSPHAGCGSRRGFWSPSTIRNMLQNRKYTGLWEYNKTRWIKKSVSSKRRSLPNPPEMWERLESEELRIISDGLYHAANRIPTKKQKRSSGNKKYLLSGLLICAECGATFDVVNSGRYSCYMCRTARTQGANACSSKRRLSRQVIEENLISNVVSELADPEVVKTLCSMVNEKLTSNTGMSQSRIQSLKEQDKTLQVQIERLLDSLENGAELPSIRSRLAQRESERAGIEAELAMAASVPANPIEVSEEWLQGKLRSFASCVTRQEDKIPILRNELRRLFPEKLRVSIDRQSEGGQIKVSGRMSPLPILVPPDQYQSIIAEQGLEPRTRLEALP